jgi:hypothetical protein
MIAVILVALAVLVGTPQIVAAAVEVAAKPRSRRSTVGANS